MTPSAAGQPVASLLAHDVPIDLTNCDREPIHIPGQIQSHGALLAVDRKSLAVIQVSENVALFFGRDPSALLGAELRGLLDAPDLTGVTRILEEKTAERTSIHAFRGRVAGAGPFDVSVYTDGPLAVFEAERVPEATTPAPDFYAFASRTVGRLRGAATTAAYCDALASAIRSLTGYDRVMIYRFADDWSGHVVAESMVDDQGLISFLDLHYPASDIPAQARALFAKNTVRMLADARAPHAKLVPEPNPVTGEPLDMSPAFLRGASPMYTEYLDNMGVRASLTLALGDRERLWGLVACHHYTPRVLSHGTRIVCDLISQLASVQIADKLLADEAAYRSRIQSIHALLVESLASGGSQAGALAKHMATLRSFVACTGVAVVGADAVHLDGVVPPLEHLERLATLLSATATRGVVATERLARLYPDAETFADRACGMLAVQLSETPGEYIVWFRPEVIRTVKWAGDPTKPVTAGPRGDRLTPRKSFELWAETVRRSSEPWTALELASAKRLRASFKELVLRRSREMERLNRALQSANSELQAFAYAASHDLKEPLRGIYNHAEFLRRDAAARLDDADRRRLDSIARLSTRMRSLIDSLLEYSQVGQHTLTPDNVVLDLVLSNSLDSLSSLCEERKARVRVQTSLPVVRGVTRFYDQIFTNLISNAIKYNDAPVPDVEVGFVRAGAPGFPMQATGAELAFFVRDNGIGISERHRDAVFRIFKRLHAADKYGGGTGAGLTIVKKLVERMQGKIWIGSESPGTTIWFSVPNDEGGASS